MEDSTLIVLLTIILILLLVGYVFLHKYGINIGLYDILLLFIIFVGLALAWKESSEKSNKYSFQNTKSTNQSVRNNVNTPIVNTKENDGKIPDLSKINLADYGVGGLNKQVETIFTEALYTRFLPTEKIKKAGIKHTKGIILYGPPGTGKTTIVRMVANILNAEVQIINGPEIFSKWVGQSEENMREIFKPAKEEYQKYGDKARLHLVIFDEIDAIAPARGGHVSGSGVSDTVVNQFLTAMDGVEQFDNIIVFGTTNRLDMLDTGLTRSGRFSVKIEIGMPDSESRLSILKVHAGKKIAAGMFSDDIDLEQLANDDITHGYTGADLEELIRSACAYAIKRNIEECRTDPNKEIMIEVDDINYALRNIIPYGGNKAKTPTPTGDYKNMSEYNNVIKAMHEMSKNYESPAIHSKQDVPIQDIPIQE